MSLTFAATTTDAVNCGSNAVLDSLAEITILTWMYPTSFGSNQFIMTKRDAGNAGWGHRINDASGNLYVNKPKVAGGVSAVTNDAPLTVNAWNFVAATGSNNVSSNNCSIYTGDLTTLAVERSYGTRGSLASGAPFNDAALNLLIGNRPSVSQSFVGRLGVQAIFNRVLTLAEIQSWQFDPRVMDGCVGLWNLGDNGTGTQPDYSGNGNNGTVTGATQSDNPPLRRRWGRRVLVSTPSAVSGDVTLAPTGLGMSMSLGTPVVSGGSAQAPTGLSVTASLGAPVVSGGATVLPTGLAMAAELGTPAVSAAGGVTVLPTATAMTAALGTPVASGGSAAAVTGLGVTASLGVPVVTGGATLAPTGLGLSANLGTPFVSVGGAANISIVGIAMSADLGAPVVSVSREVTPAGLALSTALGVPVLTIGATITPTGLELVAYLTGPTVVADIPNGTAFRITDRSGPRYVLDSLSGARYPITHRSGPRYHITERDT